MDGAQGAGLVDLLRLPRAVPVHYDDYTVFASPLAEFRDRMRSRFAEPSSQPFSRGEKGFKREAAYST